MTDPDVHERRFAAALHFGRFDEIEELLARQPDLASSTLASMVATYDVDGVKAYLARDPGAARASRGDGSTRPLLAHLCFSRYHEVVPERREAMLEIARTLVEHGADPNAWVPVGPGDPGRLSMLYGAIGHARNLPLARWLLGQGASPNDFESLYHATELGDPSGVALLLEFGADPLHTNALLRAIDMHDPAMVAMLLEAGADPDDAYVLDTLGRRSPSPPAVWHAARVGAPREVARLLVEAGADLARVWDGRDAYGTARVYGSGAVEEVLREHGAARPLDPLESTLAACVAGSPPSPGSVVPLDLATPGDRTLLHTVAARPGSATALRSLVQVGFDPGAVDGQGMTPLHVAAWEGLAENVAFLLTVPHDLAHRNVYGGDAMGTLIHGAEFSPSADDRDHLACARMLLTAGAVADRADVDACGVPDLVQLLRAGT